jgi:hypothetical protein
MVAAAMLACSQAMAADITESISRDKTKFDREITISGEKKSGQKAVALLDLQEIE